MQLVLEVHMQNIICKVEYISCLSIFLLISFLYILLQAICTTWLRFFFFFCTNFFFLFLRNYYEQLCRCKSDLCTEHCKFEFMALLITHSIENDVQFFPPRFERDPVVLISNEKGNNLPLWDIYPLDIYTGYCLEHCFFANGADQFFCGFVAVFFS